MLQQALHGARGVRTLLAGRSGSLRSASVMPVGLDLAAMIGQFLIGVQRWLIGARASLAKPSLKMPANIAATSQQAKLLPRLGSMSPLPV